VAQSAGQPSLCLDVEAIAAGRQTAADIVAWAIAQPESTTPVIYSSAEPEALQLIQKRMGPHESGALVETAMASVAVCLRDADLSRFLIAGGGNGWGGDRGTGCFDAGNRPRDRAGRALDAQRQWGGPCAGAEIGQLRCARFLSESVVAA